MGKVSPKDSDSKISARKKKLKSSTNKYLKPGALVQLCYSKASAAAKSCNNDLGKKRVPVFDTKHARSNQISVEHFSSPKSPLISSPDNIVKRSSLVRPMKFDDLQVESNKKSPLMLSPMGIVMQNTLLRTPKTPQADPCNSESQLESLPMDLLVFISCTFTSIIPFGSHLNIWSLFSHSFFAYDGYFQLGICLQVKIVCHLHHDQLKAVFHVSQRIRTAVCSFPLYLF